MGSQGQVGVGHERTQRVVRRSASPSFSSQRRCTQRDRLLAAITELPGRRSVDALTVGEIVAQAGVSRPTFYEYFTDKEDCFLQAIAPIRDQLLAEIRQAVAAQPSRYAAVAAIRALLAFAEAEPQAARLLIADTLAGGRRALDARDALIAQLASPVADAFARVRATTAIPDLPPRLLIGVTCRLLAARLAAGHPCPPQLLGELMDWLRAYDLPAAEHRSRALAPLDAREDPAFVSIAKLRPPPALAPGRPRIVEEAVENQWLRIVFATADVVAADGYAASTVAHISRRAGLDPRAFYRLFACKEQALAAARELTFRHVMAATAGAAIGATWPERIRHASRALTLYLERNPTLAYVSIAEGHAGGQIAMGRLQELVSAFTIFLQEGYRSERSGDDRSAPPSDLALEAAVTSVFELCYLQCREPGNEGLSAMTEHVAFICLAPFLGADDANAFLRRKSVAAGSQPTRQSSARRREKQPFHRPPRPIAVA